VMKWWLCCFIALAAAAPAQEQKRLAGEERRVEANVALTVYLVSGLAQADQGAKDDVPQPLAETLQQLRGVFTYKTYRLIDTVTLRGRSYSGAEVAGELPDNSQYDFSYTRARVGSGAPRLVHLDGLRLSITRRRGAGADTLALVSTDLDVKDGEKTVVGKSAVNGVNALFLVIVAKVIE
jgi:hypothetical protein